MGGAFGANPGDNGVVGQTNSDINAGVNGRNDGRGFGVFGFSQGGAGVEGHSEAADGVVGFSTNGTGVLGRSAKNGVAGQTTSDVDAGVNGRNDGRGFGVFGLIQGGVGRVEARRVAWLDKPRVMSMRASTAETMAEALASLASARAGTVWRAIAPTASALSGSAPTASPGGFYGMCG